MYDVMSPKAEEFISDEEIRASLAYAEENKNNRELIEQILEKASKMEGLSHREAIVLLDCGLEDLNEQIYRLAEAIKQEFLRRCIYPTTVSTAANTAHII